MHAARSANIQNGAKGKISNNRKQSAQFHDENSRRQAHTCTAIDKTIQTIRNNAEDGETAEVRLLNKVVRLREEKCKKVD